MRSRSGVSGRFLTIFIPFCVRPGAVFGLTRHYRAGSKQRKSDDPRWPDHCVEMVSRRCRQASCSADQAPSLPALTRGGPIKAG